eukprot:3006746-Rhodomonas_salina.1
MMLELGRVMTHCWSVAQAPSNGSASTRMLQMHAGLKEQPCHNSGTETACFDKGQLSCHTELLISI